MVFVALKKITMGRALQGLAAMVLLAGGAHAAENGVEPVFFYRPPLMKVVDELDQRHMAVSTVFAKLHVTLRDTVKNKKHLLEGIYAGDKNGNLRLRIKVPDGPTVIDMGVNGEKTDIWLPRKGRYFQGKCQDLMDNTECQLSLLVHAGKARDLFFPRAWTPNAVKRTVVYERGREIINVIEKPNFLRKRTRRLTISLDSATVENMEFFDKQGREVGELKYANYKDMNPTQEWKPGEARQMYPEKITLKSKEGTHELEMVVEEMLLNEPVSQDSYNVPRPEEVTRVLDLGKALEKSGSLWE